jgi:HSP20 family protein
MKSVQRRLSLYHAESAVWPLIDLYETASVLVFEIDLPGMEPEDISIIADGEVLIIEGVRNDSSNDADLKYICMERGIRGFRRVIKIPVPVNASEGSAYYERGVVSIKFPKLERRAVAITVKRANE